MVRGSVFSILLVMLLVLAVSLSAYIFYTTFEIKLIVAEQTAENEEQTDTINAKENTHPAEPPNITSPRPKYRRMSEAYCGNWQQEYATRALAMAAGHQPPRWMVWSCEHNCGGLGDRFMGIVTAFTFALVTNRTLLVDWRYPIPAADVLEANEVPYWQYNSSLPGADMKAKDAASFDRQYVFDRHPLADTTPEERWKKPSVMLSGGRGYVYRSFSHPNIGPRLRALGLRPDTAFGCLLNYLFRPHRDIAGEVERYVKILDTPDVFSVGIQIRHHYDSSFADKRDARSADQQEYQKFWRCAKQLEETYALRSQRVVWLLATDSLSLKRSAVNASVVPEFASKILTTEIVPRHIDKLQDGSEESRQALREQMIENFILSYVDKFVISESGFAKVAVYRSLRLRDTYLMTHHQGDPAANFTFNEVQDCGAEDAYTPMSILGSYWSAG